MLKNFEHIYITGDKHADFLELITQSKRFGFTDRDLLIITGDVGINYFGDERDMHPKKTLSEVPCTILCVRGNHEMRPTDPRLQGKYTETMWMGDTAYIERDFPRFVMAADGARYTINGRSFLVIGGAYSVDKAYRQIMGWQWFSDEQLSPDEMMAIKEKIRTHGDHEDIILAHTCPYDFRPLECLNTGIDERKVDKSMEHFLQDIIDSVAYQQLYCGHWHIDKQDEKVRFLFRDIVLLPDAS